MWALVPLKLLAHAKQRLAAMLSPEQRRELVLAMAADVLRALAASSSIQQILIISRNVEAQSLAQRFNARIFKESADADLPGALNEAIEYATGQAATGVCIIPADAPLVTAADIDLLIGAHERCTVVPDAQLEGTNALVLTPPTAMQPIFDGRSFKPHLKAAIAGRVPVRVLRTAGFALDIDTPEDVQQLLRSPASSQAKDFLAGLPTGVAQ